MSATQTEPKAETNGTVPEAKGLTAKLVAAALAVEPVERKGHNNFHNYDYVRAEDIAAAATKVLLSHRVLSEFECVDAELQATAKGMLATVTCRLTVTDADSGEQIERTAMGSGSDNPGDKAIYKAMTGARKYAYMHLLGIPLGDDPDASPGSAPKRSATPQLERKRVESLRDRMKGLGLDWERVELLLGAAGVDAPKARRKDSLLKTLREMSSAQADQLEAVLAKEGEGD